MTITLGPVQFIGHQGTFIEKIRTHRLTPSNTLPMLKNHIGSTHPYPSVQARRKPPRFDSAPRARNRELKDRFIVHFNQDKSGNPRAAKVEANARVSALAHEVDPKNCFHLDHRIVQDNAFGAHPRTNSLSSLTLDDRLDVHGVFDGTLFDGASAGQLAEKLKGMGLTRVGVMEVTGGPVGRGDFLEHLRDELAVRGIEVGYLSGPKVYSSGTRFARDGNRNVTFDPKTQQRRLLGYTTHGVAERDLESAASHRHGPAQRAGHKLLSLVGLRTDERKATEFVESVRSRPTKTRPDPFDKMFTSYEMTANDKTARVSVENDVQKESARDPLATGLHHVLAKNPGLKRSMEQLKDDRWTIKYGNKTSVSQDLKTIVLDINAPADALRTLRVRLQDVKLSNDRPLTAVAVERAHRHMMSQDVDGRYASACYDLRDGGFDRGDGWYSALARYIEHPGNRPEGLAAFDPRTPDDPVILTAYLKMKPELDEVAPNARHPLELQPFIAELIGWKVRHEGFVPA
jgi:hypothetical protein